jgi:ElaB/YqjD/DUF883 family membrane-anchored ribosome-binding protein
MTSRHAEALRTIDDVRRLLDETLGAGDLVARAAEARTRLEAALESLEASAREKIAAAPRTLQEDLAEAERKIRENPLGAVLVAAGLGFLVALLMRRR